jgi:hypothetical protein
LLCIDLRHVSPSSFRHVSRVSCLCTAFATSWNRGTSWSVSSKRISRELLQKLYSYIILCQFCRKKQIYFLVII